MAPKKIRLPAQGSSLDDPVACMAGDWLIRHDRGLTAEEQEAFNRWLHAEPRHAEVYAEVKRMWTLLDRMSDLPAPAAPRTRRWSPPWRAVSLMAAAVVMISVLAWWSVSPSRFKTVAETDAGGWHRLELPDGSVVQLNAASAVNVDFSSAERRVRLVRGQAFFAVAKDADRPFVVRAGKIDVRAVGTAFDVRLGPQAVDVLVTEGRVQVKDSTNGQPVCEATPPPPRPDTASAGLPPSTTGEPALIAAGQRATIDLHTSEAPTLLAVASLSPEETARALAWQDRRLSFDDTPLSELVETFNRHNRHQLIIVDSRLAARRFGGTFPAGDYATLVHLLEKDFGVVAESNGDVTRLRLP